MNFAEGKKEDMAAMMDGIKLARSLNSGKKLDKVIQEEIWPPKVNPSTGALINSPKELEKFVMQEIWGHHASCTSKMGPSPEKGDVVNSNFEVHNVKGLSIVDASIFPKIPGLFIVAPIYTIAEKAADVLTKKYHKG